MIKKKKIHTTTVYYYSVLIKVKNTLGGLKTVIM